MMIADMQFNPYLYKGVKDSEESDAFLYEDEETFEATSVIPPIVFDKQKIFFVMNRQFEFSVLYKEKIIASLSESFKIIFSFSNWSSSKAHSDRGVLDKMAKITNYLCTGVEFVLIDKSASLVTKKHENKEEEKNSETQELNFKVRKKKQSYTVHVPSVKSEKEDVHYELLEDS